MMWKATIMRESPGPLELLRWSPDKVYSRRGSRFVNCWQRFPRRCLDSPEPEPRVIRGLRFFCTSGDVFFFPVAHIVSALFAWAFLTRNFPNRRFCGWSIRSVQHSQGLSELCNQLRL